MTTFVNLRISSFKAKAEVVTLENRPVNKQYLIKGG